MEKIVKALLKSRFPNSSIDALMEVVYNTPDATVATEILCGIYEEPVINIVPSDAFVNARAKNNVHDIQLIGYNKWTKNIEYSYMQKKSKDYFKHKKAAYELTYEEAVQANHGWDLSAYLRDNNIPDDERNEYIRMTAYGELTTTRSTTVTDAIDLWNESTPNMVY